MTPKEKAIELVEKFIDLQDENLKECDYRFSKLCALITVDEIIRDNASIYSQQYWNEVKQEIEKL